MHGFMFCVRVSFYSFRTSVCLYKGQKEKKEGKCKYLVHLCITASVIRAQISYNYRPGSCAAQFSLVKKRQKKGGTVCGTWDLKVSKARNLETQVVSCCK